MSEEEYLEETISEEDFGDNSEDDWNPNGATASSDSDFEATGSSPSPQKRPKTSASKKKQQPNNRSQAEKPTKSGKIMSGSIRELLEKAKAGKRAKLNLSADEEPAMVKKDSPKKTMTRNKPKAPPVEEQSVDDDDGSSSSGDEYLVPAKELDLGSTFFETSKEQDRVPPPNFDCNLGLGSLSDSDQDDLEAVDDEDEEKDKSHEKAKDIMQNLKNFAQNMEDARENLKRHEEKKADVRDTTVDVTSLLALGEAQDTKPVGKAKPAPAKKRRAKDEDSGGSDWEEVEDADDSVPPPPDSSRHPDNVQFTLNLPTDGRRKRVQNELELAIKRQLNKEKREKQVLIHQDGFREWLEQGNHINGVLNNTALFEIALKLLPSAYAYPKDKADMAYFEQITKWYCSAIKITTSEMYPPLVDDLDIMNSLRSQMEKRKAKCRRDFILIFVILLRAIGIQCRMVINLPVPPLRPKLSELCRINAKGEDEDFDRIVKELSAMKSEKEQSNSPKPGTSKTDKPVKKEESKSEEKSNSKKEVPKKVEAKPAKKAATSKRSPKVKTDSPSALSSKKPESDSSILSKTKKSVPKIRDSSKVNSNQTSSPQENPNVRTRRGKTKQPETQSPHFPSKTDSDNSLINGSVLKPRATRSTKKTQVASTCIPQLDGMDSLATPVSKRTRSRSRTPVPENKPLKKIVVSKTSADSPIKSKRKSISNTLSVPSASASTSAKKPKVGGTSSELFAVDPTEKVTIRKKNTKTKREPDDDDFEPDAPSKKSPRYAAKIVDRRVLSTDDEDVDINRSGKTDFWPEVWLEKEEKWACVDLFKEKVGNCDSVVRGATTPIAYVLAWGNDSMVKDVSLRYCPSFHSVNRKLRTDQAFVDKALLPYSGHPTDRDKKENLELSQIQLERGIPTTVSAFKNHPVYALKRHLLKFEAIYPPEPLILGYVNGEAVYARECVHVLHSRELWVKQARVVKPGETPYKIVTARPKWDRATNNVIKDQPLEIFGVWQTAEYEPPVAENGIVPKNAYGNVELFKECMLPINTVHLPYPGLMKTCKKLKIDCAPAVVGFDFHGGWSHPVYEGFVVCKEFAEIVTDAWIRDTEEATKREEEKFMERVYGNWKRLIKGLLIKRRLQLKYKFEDEQEVAAQD